MPEIEVRPFRRSDRDQVTALVNAHIGAVVPGLTASVNAVMSQLESEPGEFIVDPWVSERATLVTEQRGRVVAAAHVLRYADHSRVSDSYRDTGSIRWFVFWPPAPYWPDSAPAADELLDACIEQLGHWNVARQFADGALPAPAIYGVPDQWPHIADAYERAGFVWNGHTELIYIAALSDLPLPLSEPVPTMSLTRTVGTNGTRFSALLDDERIGMIEIEVPGEPGRFTRARGFGQIGNLEVVEAYRERGVRTWLLSHAADWLRLAGVDHVVGYGFPGDHAATFYERTPGFRQLTRVRRVWQREGEQERPVGR